MNNLDHQIGHDLRSATKLVSQFLSTYKILSELYKFSSKTDLEKHLEIETG
jgi:hypothetical protein